MSKLRIDNKGCLVLPPAVARQIGAAELELASASAGHLFFTAAGAQGGVTLAGILGETSAADVLSLFNMVRKTGVLSFTLSGGSKQLYLQDGEVVFAASSFPREDLGEILLGLGKIEPSLLQRARRAAVGGTSLGKLLVEEGTVTAKDLWLASRHQVETIVYALMGCQHGAFHFLAKSLENEEIVRLSLSTQNLIMEGLRRMDETALFMRTIRSLDRVPRPTGLAVAGLTAAEERLLGQIGSGGRSARELLRRSGLGEFDGLRLLYQLVEKKLLQMEEEPVARLSGPVGEIFTILNGAQIFLARRVMGCFDGFRAEVDRFLRDLPQPFSYVFRDVTLGEDGAVDGCRVAANLAGLGEADQKKLLAEAFNELIFMECVIARRELAATDWPELADRVQEISRRVKRLIGRKDEV